MSLVYVQIQPRRKKLTPLPSGQQAVIDLQDGPSSPFLVKPEHTISNHCKLIYLKMQQHTKNIKILNKRELSTRLLLGTDDGGKQTLGQKTGEEAVGVDVGVLETAGEVAAAALVLLLVDVDGGGGRAGLSR